ncbi:MAG: ABC transporter ATP-binding protein [Solirubrobacteraceae bacterium]|nr:ABC transporter ATP-binding protein [Solirubrobacteraceae bacterium]
MSGDGSPPPPRYVSESDAPAPPLRGRAEVRRRLQSTRGGGRKLRRLGPLLRPYRGRVIAMFAALVAATLAALAPGPLVKHAIDDGIQQGDARVLTIIVGLFIVSALLVWAGTALQTYLVSWVGQRVLQDLRIQIFAHLQRLPVSFYERKRTGVLISRLTNDVQALDTLVSDAVVTLFQAGLTLIGASAILFFYDAQLALLAFAVLPVVVIGSVLFRIAAADAYKRTRETIGALSAELQETLSGVRVVRAFGREDRHLERFAELNEENRAANMFTVHLNAAYFPAVEFASAVATLLVLSVGGVQVIQGETTIGVLVLFMATLGSFFDPIQQLSQLYTTYQSGLAALDKIFELLDEPVDLTDAKDAIDLPHVEGRLSLDGVSFRYSPQTPWALRDVSVNVEAGQTLALVGATGAGKSTLAKLLARFYDPTEGTVRIDGHDLRDVHQQSLRRQLGIVPQEPFLFSGTIADNLRFGRPDATDEELMAALSAIGAAEFVSALEDGLDAEIGERGVQLSGGQRQLLAFARMLLADPRLLILDEATAAVDPRSERLIEQALHTLMAGRTVVVIAHRLSTIRGADQIAVLEGGAVTEVGTHASLVAAGGRYADLDASWRSQGVAGAAGVGAGTGATKDPAS